MNGESCDNGVIARYTCVGCGDFYEKEFKELVSVCKKFEPNIDFDL